MELALTVAALGTIELILRRWVARVQARNIVIRKGGGDAFSEADLTLVFAKIGMVFWPILIVGSLILAIDSILSFP